MTHIKEKTKHIRKELKEHYPDIDEKIIETFIDKMPDEAYLTYLFFQNEEEENYHLLNKMQYDKAVELFDWIDDKGTGAKWTIDEITRGMNFDNKEYTKYDFAYVSNMLYSDYCNVFTESSYYLKMARNYLEDPDYCGDSSERAYHNARKRIKYYSSEE